MDSHYSGLRLVATSCLWLGGFVVGVGGLLLLYVVVAWLRLPDVEALGRAGDPGVTAFMQSDACETHERTYVPLGEMDPALVCAVVWAEDRRFFHHDGVDRRAFKGALRANATRRTFRLGGSTIPMQLARNLFLSRARVVSRKFKEMVMAMRLVEAFSRERVLELYLNSAQWGPCTYGAEAASRDRFGHSARDLSPAEATLLAALLPRSSLPIGYVATDRAALERKQQRLLSFLWRAGLLTKSELATQRSLVTSGWRHGWQRLPSAGSGPALNTGNWVGRLCGTRPSGTIPIARRRRDVPGVGKIERPTMR